MNSKKHSITMILAMVLALSLLLTACGKGGDTPTGDNSSTPETSSTPDVTDAVTPPNFTTDLPTTEPDDTTEPDPPISKDSDTPYSPVADATESGTVSVAGETYRSARCEFSLPDGLKCTGTIRDNNYALFLTVWEKSDDFSLSTDVNNGGGVAGQWFHIRENDDRVSDFETRTVEYWYEYLFEYFNQLSGGNMIPTDLPDNYRDRKIEQKTVDGYPAVRASWVIPVQASNDAYDELWMIDTPNGNIMIRATNSNTSCNYEENAKWVEDIISTIRINP